LVDGRDPLRLISIVSLRSVTWLTTNLWAMPGPEPSSNAMPPDAQSRHLRVSLQSIACTCRSMLHPVLLAARR
jgi:hypothetical protein